MTWQCSWIRESRESCYLTVSGEVAAGSGGSSCRSLEWLREGMDFEMAGSIGVIGAEVSSKRGAASEMAPAFSCLNMCHDVDEGQNLDHYTII